MGTETGAIPPAPQKTSPVVNLNAMDNQTRAMYDALSEEDKVLYLGGGGRPRPDFDVPGFNKQTYEKIYYKGNAWITFGLDRPGFENSGFGGDSGGTGTHCASIDIVAGRKSWYATSQTKRSRRPITVDNDFAIDAARIYLSQKADVDGYFRLPAGKVGNTSKESPRSCIAAKADTVRIIARENIKFVTKTDQYNSQGATLKDELKGQYGIDIIAMEDESSLQPMVRGKNLQQFLLILMESMSQMLSTQSTYIIQTRKITSALMSHSHFSPFFGNKTAPDFIDSIPTGINTLIDNITNVDVGNMTHQQAMNAVKMAYLENTGAETLDPETAAPLNILSPYNHNN
tara:strand:+ start:333 stop:1364 length:1032 start_codon:yes stop_codon:yes gene_type:complete